MTPGAFRSRLLARIVSHGPASRRIGSRRFESGNEALKIVKLVILITDTLSLNVVICLAGEFEGLLGISWPGHEIPNAVK
jgi:hypothetical protein